MINFQRIRFFFNACFISFLTLSISPAFAKETLVEARPDVQSFINFMVNNYGFDKPQLTTMFNTIPIAPSTSNYKNRPVIKQMVGRHDFIPWYQYQAFFIDQNRINMGVSYWQANYKWLNRAYQLYGVPKSIVVATIGIESKYGTEMGVYSVFQSLAVLAFDYSSRKDYFKQQLIAFLVYCKANNIDPLSVKGSYAGAIGQPQFMPNNLALYTTDLDHQNQIDIINDSADAIGSVAHFYHLNKWRTGEPVAIPAVITGDKINVLLRNNPEPRLTLAEFAQYGITPQQAVADSSLPANLISLTGANGPEYWLAFHNFFVIKDYNASTDYAMALYQLSVLIHHDYKLQLKAKIAALKAKEAALKAAQEAAELKAQQAALLQAKEKAKANQNHKTNFNKKTYPTNSFHTAAK